MNSHEIAHLCFFLHRKIYALILNPLKTLFKLNQQKLGPTKIKPVTAWNFFVLDNLIDQICDSSCGTVLREQED